MSSTDDSSASDERGTSKDPTERVVRWVLLDGNRVAVAASVLAVLAAFFAAAELLGWFPMRRSQPTYYVFSALISGNLTLITVVVSINQLLLSRELKSPGELESQMENVIEYRKEVEDAAGEIAPVKPMGFLRLLFENTRREAQRTGGLATYVDSADSDAQDRVTDLISDLTEQIDEALDVLESSEAGTFKVLSVTLMTNYAEQINGIRRIQANFGDDLSDETMSALDDIIQRLEDIDVARQYFKSVYLQDELSSLSRVLLYAGIPAEALSVAVLFAITGGGTPALRHAGVVLPTAAVVGFLPLSLLFAFILRTSTVTERTTATLPFTTPEQEQE